MTTVFLDAVFKPFFKNRPWHGPTSDDRSDEFPDGWLLSNHSTYGVCERKHAISNTPKKKIARWKIGRPWHVSETGNEVPGKHVSNSGHWLVCSVRCGTIFLNHTLAQFILLRRSSEYYPFKRCQVPVSHPVQMGKAWEPLKKLCSFGNLGVMGRKAVSRSVWPCCNFSEAGVSQWH